MLSTLLGLASAAALAIGVSACGGGGTPATTKPAADIGSAPTTGNAKPSPGGTIYYAHDLEVPCLQGGWVEESYIERQFTDSLVSQVSSGHIVPWLATSWSVSKDQLTWTFHLKPGVSFSDGTPLNAQAVVDNFDYWTNPKTANGDVDAYIGPYFNSAKAINDLTVQLNLKRRIRRCCRRCRRATTGSCRPRASPAEPTPAAMTRSAAARSSSRSGTTARTSCSCATRTTTRRRPMRRIRGRRM
jgi:ABC-type transport system substrate-binding protein